MIRIRLRAEPSLSDNRPSWRPADVLSTTKPIWTQRVTQLRLMEAFPVSPHKNLTVCFVCWQVVLKTVCGRVEQTEQEFLPSRSVNQSEPASSSSKH